MRMVLSMISNTRMWMCKQIKQIIWLFTLSTRSSNIMFLVSKPIHFQHFFTHRYNYTYFLDEKFYFISFLYFQFWRRDTYSCFNIINEIVQYFRHIIFNSMRSMFVQRIPYIAQSTADPEFIRLMQLNIRIMLYVWYQ